MKLGPFTIERRRSGNGIVILAEDDPDYGEIGSTGIASSYRGIVMGDYNRNLSGKKGVETYDKMRRSDSQVRATLKIAKVPLLSAEYFIEPASRAPEHLDQAQLVWWNFHNLNRVFIQFIWESLLMVDFGYYVFEKVFETALWRPQRKGANKREIVKWKKLAPRHPKTIEDWIFDAEGGVQGVKHNRGYPNKTDIVPIEIKRLLLFVLDEEGGNPEGISMLRSSYQNWYYKSNLYKVDAIQKERHGIGVPRGKVPANASEDDKKKMVELVENLRTNEKAGFVLPAEGFELDFMELRGQPVDVLASAQHHDLQIARNVLAQFINLGGNETGSRAVSSAQQDFFLKATRYLADLVRGIINQFAIRQLVDYNFDTDVYPELRVRRIGEGGDLRALSVALRNLVEVGLITPTPELEEWVSREFDMPSPSPDALKIDTAQRMQRMKRGAADRVEKPAEV